MAKFDSTQYAALWSKEGRAIQSLILNDPTRIPQFYTFWREKFTVDPVTTPTQPDGTATFSIKQRMMETGVLMDMRAPLADGTPMERGNAAHYEGTIPDFIGKVYVEKATEREYREQLFEQVGEDNAALAGYTIDFLQSNINAANQTLSYMAAQMLSTAKVNYNQGEGIQGGIAKAPVPTDNFLNAGGVVWSDTTNFKFLDWGRDLVERLNNKYGVDMAWQVEIPKNIWLNYIVKNAQVIEQIRFVNNSNGILLPATAQMTEDMAMSAIRKWVGMPNIVIVEEKQKDITNGVVSGWAENTVVVRPSGYAGKVVHTTNLDARMSKYQNNLISAVYTPALGGLMTIENAVVPNGIYKEWHAKAMMQAVPVLDEFLYHYIIKVNVAGTAYNF